MSSLYKDAIADARKLRETAEQNAKNRIIEAVTPKLRRMIERQISEGDDELVDDVESELLDAPDAMDMLDQEDDFEPAAAEPMDLAPGSMDVDSDGLASIEVVPDEVEAKEYEDESQNKSVHVNITVEGRKNYLLRHRAIRLVKALSEAKTRKQRQKIRKELAILREALIITENSQNVRLAKNIKVILKESTMRRRRNSWLFEGEDGPAEEVEFGDADLDDGGTEDSEMGGGDAAEDMSLSDLLSLAAEKADELEEGGDDDDFDIELDDDEPDSDEDDAGDETYEYDAGDEGSSSSAGSSSRLSETDEDECGEADEMGDESDDNDEVIEVNEAMLRRALGASRRRRPSRRSSRRVNESRRARIARARRRRRLAEGEAKAMAGHFGGGKAGKEMFVDVDENTLLNALAEELGSYPSVSGGQAAAKASHFGGGAVKKGAVMEARAHRKTKRSLKEAKRIANKNARVAKAAKAELKESNLFNAKLLFVTKLLQSHSLNNKQQRAIIEAMDNAKTQREAKLLFTSLNESLNNKVRQNSSSSRLTENRSRTGSSSRSLQSGQAPRGNGVELDRWAVLAGLKK